MSKSCACTPLQETSFPFSPHPNCMHCTSLFLAILPTHHIHLYPPFPNLPYQPQAHPISLILSHHLLLLFPFKRRSPQLHSHFHPYPYLHTQGRSLPSKCLVKVCISQDGLNKNQKLSNSPWEGPALCTGSCLFGISQGKVSVLWKDLRKGR